MDRVFSAVEHIRLCGFKTHPDHPFYQLEGVVFCTWCHSRELELDNASSLLSAPLLTSHIDFDQVKNFSLLQFPHLLV